MSNAESLYEELKDDLETVAEPLFEHACGQVQKRGAFLPVGERLSATGEAVLVAAAPDEDFTTSEVVLPLLVAALQQFATDAEAVALCEWVKIETEPGNQQDAVKVHVHHRRGIAVAFYVPATKPFLREWQFGEMIAAPAGGLITSWASG